jgi:hypothetical protein
MSYTSELVSGKRYKISTEFDSKPITFDVIVANDESEVEGLVAFYLNEKANPPTFPVQTTDGA